MKILFIILASLVVFSGCARHSVDHKLRNQKAKEARYKKQQARKKAKEEALRKKKRREARNAIPKAPKKNIVLKKVEDNNYSADYMYPKDKESTPPKKRLSSSETNRSKEMTPPKERLTPNEMTPPKERLASSETTISQKNQIVPLPVPSSTMTKEECVSIIGQAKYDMYTQKFGSESATLKRCKMLKSMK